LLSSSCASRKSVCVRNGCSSISSVPACTAGSVFVSSRACFDARAIEHEDPAPRRIRLG
jgi:hypothetical protein